MSGLITDMEIKAAKVGRCHTGEPGLYLVVKQGKTDISKRFVFRFTSPRTQRVTEVAIGIYPACSFKKARAIVAEKQAILAKGECPVTVQKIPEAPVSLTFGAVIPLYKEAMKVKWRDPDTAKTNERLLALHANKLTNLPVETITAKVLIEALTPAFKKSQDTGRRVLELVRRILNFAHAHEYRNDPAPAYKGLLEHRFPKIAKMAANHHAALPHEELPALASELRSRGVASVSAQAILLCMLTACRTKEIGELTWREVDLDKALITIPASRMKAGAEHIVPLSTQAIALLRGLREFADPARNPYVFVGSANRDRKPRSISPTGMYQYLTATLHIHDGTVHGFRTGFRNWAAENGVDFIAAEHALAHRAGNAVTQAYYRTTLIDARRKVMQDWADFLYCAEAAEAEGDNVVPMVRRSA